jgi:hypothetical protein
VPSNLGENVVRLRYAAVPLAALTLSLRRWRPLPVAIAAFALALSWNATPLAYTVFRSSDDPSSAQAYWQPVIGFLHRSLSPSYRVEAVGTAGHWEALYLAQAKIPIVRGWFRQDDFPENAVLYRNLNRTSYLHWLRRLSVRYVVLTDAPTDYSARTEAELLRSGSSGLPIVFATAHATVYAVPSPLPILTGPGRPHVDQVSESSVTVTITRPGTYRLGISYSPYLRAPTTCLTESRDGMTLLTATRPGRLHLAFDVSAASVFAALTGRTSSCPEEDPSGGP